MWCKLSRVDENRYDGQIVFYQRMSDCDGYNSDGYRRKNRWRLRTYQEKDARRVEHPL